MSHLTESNRIKIELGLRNGMSFQELAKMLGKARSTILREVKKHRQISLKGAPGRVHNRCVHRRNCDVYALCGDSKCNRKCSACRKCNSLCSKFKEETCLRLSKVPYVCNGCPDEHKCVLKKQHYICSTASKEYL